MKKIFLIALISFATLTASAQRWQNAPKDNTGRNLTFLSVTTKTLAATDSIKPCGSESFYRFTSILGNKTLTLKTTEAKLWDRVTLEFTSDSIRVVTFGTGSGSGSRLWTTVSGNTIATKADKKSLITFLYDGTYWCEERRSLQY